MRYLIPSQAITRWLHDRAMARYTRLSEHAKDTLSVARLLMELLVDVGPCFLDTASAMVLMSHELAHPAHNASLAIHQLTSVNHLVHAASQGATKDKSYISIQLEPLTTTLEAFFRDREGAYISVPLAFHQLHERLVLLVATILGDDTSPSHLSVYQQRALYPLLDHYRTWFLTLHRLRFNLTAP